MNSATLQAVFDKATAGVLAQGKRSSIGDGPDVICLYRGPEGRKCAVGQLISDEQMEKYRVANSCGVHSIPYELLNEILPGIDERGIEFLGNLQEAHDLACLGTFVESFKFRANEVATKFGLTPIK